MVLQSYYNIEVRYLREISAQSVEVNWSKLQFQDLSHKYVTYVYHINRASIIKVYKILLPADDEETQHEHGLL